MGKVHDAPPEACHDYNFTLDSIHVCRKDSGHERPHLCSCGHEFLIGRRCA